MKKILFGLIATVFFGLSGNAQEIPSTTKKVVMNTQVLTIVEASKSVYTKGMTYDDFVKNLLTPSPTIPSQDKFFRKVYGYIQNNTSSCDILKADNPEFENYVIELSKSKSNTNQSNVTAKKKWWQVLINLAVNVGVDLILPGNDINVDLFP